MVHIFLTFPTMYGTFIGIWVIFGEMLTKMNIKDNIPSKMNDDPLLKMRILAYFNVNNTNSISDFIHHYCFISISPFLPNILEHFQILREKSRKTPINSLIFLKFMQNYVYHGPYIF